MRGAKLGTQPKSKGAHGFGHWVHKVAVDQLANDILNATTGITQLGYEATKEASGLGMHLGAKAVGAKPMFKYGEHPGVFPQSRKLALGAIKGYPGLLKRDLYGEKGYDPLAPIHNLGHLPLDVVLPALDPAFRATRGVSVLRAARAGRVGDIERFKGQDARQIPEYPVEPGRGKRARGEPPPPPPVPKVLIAAVNKARANYFEHDQLIRQMIKEGLHKTEPDLYKAAFKKRQELRKAQADAEARVAKFVSPVSRGVHSEVEAAHGIKHALQDALQEANSHPPGTEVNVDHPRFREPMHADAIHQALLDHQPALDRANFRLEQDQLRRKTARQQRAADRLARGEQPSGRPPAPPAPQAAEVPGLVAAHRAANAELLDAQQRLHQATASGMHMSDPGGFSQLAEHVQQLHATVSELEDQMARVKPKRPPRPSAKKRFAEHVGRMGALTDAEQALAKQPPGSSIPVAHADYSKPMTLEEVQAEQQRIQPDYNMARLERQEQLNKHREAQSRGEKPPKDAGEAPGKKITAKEIAKFTSGHSKEAVKRAQAARAIGDEAHASYWEEVARAIEAHHQSQARVELPLPENWKPVIKTARGNKELTDQGVRSYGQPGRGGRQFALLQAGDKFRIGEIESNGQVRAIPGGMVLTKLKGAAELLNRTMEEHERNRPLTVEGTQSAQEAVRRELDPETPPPRKTKGERDVEQAAQREQTAAEQRAAKRNPWVKENWEGRKLVGKERETRTDPKNLEPLLPKGTKRASPYILKQFKTLAEAGKLDEYLRGKIILHVFQSTGHWLIDPESVKYLRAAISSKSVDEIPVSVQYRTGDPPVAGGFKYTKKAMKEHFGRVDLSEAEVRPPGPKAEARMRAEATAEQASKPRTIADIQTDLELARSASTNPRLGHTARTEAADDVLKYLEELKVAKDKSIRQPSAEVKVTKPEAPAEKPPPAEAPAPKGKRTLDEISADMAALDHEIQDASQRSAPDSVIEKLDARMQALIDERRALKKPTPDEAAALKAEKPLEPKVKPKAEEPKPEPTLESPKPAEPAATVKEPKPKKVTRIHEVKVTLKNGETHTMYRKGGDARKLKSWAMNQLPYGTDIHRADWKIRTLPVDEAKAFAKRAKVGDAKAEITVEKPTAEGGPPTATAETPSPPSREVPPEPSVKPGDAQKISDLHKKAEDLPEYPKPNAKVLGQIAKVSDDVSKAVDAYKAVDRNDFKAGVKGQSEFEKARTAAWDDMLAKMEDARAKAEAAPAPEPKLKAAGEPNKWTPSEEDVGAAGKDLMGQWEAYKKANPDAPEMPAVRYLRKALGIGEKRAKALKMHMTGGELTRGRPKLSEEEKAARQAERDAQAEAAKAEKAAQPKKRVRGTGDTPREKGLDLQSLKLRTYQLKKLGLSDSQARNVQSAMRPVIAKMKEAGTTQVPKSDALKAFKSVMGEEDGNLLFNKYFMPEGGSGPLSWGDSLMVAVHHMVNPPKGGVYRLSMEDVKRGGVEQQLPIDIPLSPSLAVRQFQMWRYHYMGLEDPTAIQRMKQRILNATPAARKAKIAKEIQMLDRWRQARLTPGHLSQAEQDKMLAEMKKNWNERRQNAGAFKKWFLDTYDTAQQMMVFLTLHMKPGYVPPNMAGQLALLMANHAFNPLSMFKATQMTREFFKLHPEMRAPALKEMQSGMYDSMLSGGRDLKGASWKIARGTRWTSEKYSKLLDDPFRLHLFIHNAMKHGYTTHEAIHDLMTKDYMSGKLREVTRRANADAIDFTLWNKAERDVFRRIIFFYPWAKGSTVWSTRFALQHPYQTVGLHALGVAAQKQNEKELGPVPSYLNGSFVFGHRKVKGLGNVPLIINPASMSLFGNFAQAVEVAGAGVSGEGTQSQQPIELFNPVASSIAGMITGVDPSTMRGYKPGTNWFDRAGVNMAKSVAVYQTYKNLKRSGAWGLSSKHDPSKVLFPYDPWDVIQKYSVGTPFTPVPLNKGEAASRAFAENIGKYGSAKRELLKNQRYVTAWNQAGVKSGAGKMPPIVLKAFQLRGERQANLAAWKDQLGRKLDPKDRLIADMSFLVGRKLFGEKQARQMLESWAGFPPSVLSEIDGKIAHEALSEAPISQWQKYLNYKLESAGYPSVSLHG